MMHSPSERAFTLRLGTRQSLLITPVMVCSPHTREGRFLHPSEAFATFQETRGLWDTGGAASAITRKMAADLGLIPSGREKVGGIHGTQMTTIYQIHLALPNKMIMGALRVAEVESLCGDDSISILIGMDIIGQGNFSVYYEGDQMHLHFSVPI